MPQEGGQGDAAPTGLSLEAADPGKDLQPLQVRSPLPLQRKLCYAIGGAPYQITGNALGFFLQIFLLDVAQLEPFHASLILFVGRAWDAVTDPAVGFLVSRSPRRRCGKLIPWIVFSMPFGVLFYFLLWFVPSDSLSVTLKFLWYLAMYCLFQTCMSVRICVCARVCDDPGRVPKKSQFFEIRILDCKDRKAVDLYCQNWKGVGRLLGAHVGSTLGTVGLWDWESMRLEGDQRRSYLVAATVLGSLYFLSCLVLFFGVKEQTGPLSPLGKARLSFFKSLRVILSHRPYVWLLCGFLCASLAFQLAQGIFAFFCTHAAGLPGSFQHLVLIMLVAASLSIPAWQLFLVRFGKKTAVFVGLSLIIPALIVITLVTHNFLVSAFMVALAGCSLSVLYLLPWSMVPDAVDDFKLRNPNCLNLEAFFYSFYVFFNKFAGGLSLGVSTMSLHFAGYRAQDCTHNRPVILTLRILMAPIPIALLLTSMTLFCSYPINEERRKEIRAEMEASG
ncbi:sodium-dependent lysophosphatidylcholine symporter 1-B-like [Sphaerodactylus townsendi]|uniref:sodium-dependent lysophosphatidylcholine symporter 1-B-like n=1 Tax=Sphaerodactylus townsendi TaxID=933632 RepID=UPI002025C134|nr:sodium-dependent lysophosphatidylcholine symporter 1-B-like [Sphaerodactylus townsendi]